MESSKRAVVVGAGAWGINIIKTLNSMKSLQAVVECDPLKYQTLQDSFPGVKIYLDLNEALKKEECPFVLATPARSHYSLGKKILESSKDIFIEKPLALDPLEANDLVKLAEHEKALLMVGHLLVYQPAIGFIKKFLKDGKLGKIYSFYQVRRNLGTVRSFENVLFSVGIHDIASLLELHESDIKSICSDSYSVVNKGVEDDMQINITFKDGVKAHLHMNWLWPYKERNMIIQGEKGSLKYDELTNVVDFYPSKIQANGSFIKEESHRIFSSKEQPLRIEMEHFLDCCEKRKTPKTNGKLGAKVIKIIIDAQVQSLSPGVQ